MGRRRGRVSRPSSDARNLAAERNSIDSAYPGKEERLISSCNYKLINSLPLTEKPAKARLSARTNKSNNLVITSDKNQSLQNCKHLVNVWKPGLKEKG
jgi:hypothetical protein